MFTIENSQELYTRVRSSPIGHSVNSVIGEQSTDLAVDWSKMWIGQTCKFCDWWKISHSRRRLTRNPAIWLDNVAA